MKLFLSIDKLILPNTLDRNNLKDLHEARTVAYTLVCLLIFGILSFAYDSFTQSYDNRFPYVYGITLLLVFSITYKFTHNTKLIGNLIGISFFFIFGYLAYTDYYLFSDSLLWYIALPVFAFQAIEVKHGIIWHITIILAFFYFYKLSLPLASSYLFDPFYYFISISSVATMVSGISLSFKLLQNKLYRDVLVKKENLSLHNIHLKKLSNDLQISNIELQNLTYMAAHDLKNPIRTIGNLSEIIKKGCNEEAPDRAMIKEYLTKIKYSADQLNDLADSLIKYAELNRELKEKKEYNSIVNTTAIVNYAINNLKYIINNTGTEIKFDTLPSVAADRDMLIQLFENLMSNAIKYKKENTTPIIEIRTKDIGSHWQFQVIDNGKGIQAENIDNIFNYLNKPNTKIRGYGIGLATCKKIITFHKGEIYAQSDGKTGSTIYFTIKK